MAVVSTILELFREAAVGVLGTTLLAALIGLLVTAGYRRVTTRAPPHGAPVLVGLAIVAGYLLSVAHRSGTIVGDLSLDHHGSAAYLLATFLAGGIAASAGSRLGDRIACGALGLTPLDAYGAAADRLRTARLAVDIDLPEDVENVDGYRPVDPSTRRALSGTTVRLPHGLATEERRKRIERHLEREFDVGYVDVTMADDGSVERLAVGRRSAELGSTLPPRTVGIAIRAASAPEASHGDPVEIWTTDGRARLVATGTLRSTSGEVATVIVDADARSRLSAGEHYRLVTRSDESTEGYRFASALRTADETIVRATVEPNGPLAGEFVGWLPGRALLVDRGGNLLALPADGEPLQPNDEVWILGSPVALDGLDEPTPEDEPGGSAIEEEGDAPTHDAEPAEIAERLPT